MRPTHPDQPSLQLPDHDLAWSNHVFDHRPTRLCANAIARPATPTRSPLEPSPLPHSLPLPIPLTLLATEGGDGPWSTLSQTTSHGHMRTPTSWMEVVAVTVTIKPMHAGKGVDYLLRTVAVGDGTGRSPIL